MLRPSGYLELAAAEGRRACAGAEPSVGLRALCAAVKAVPPQDAAVTGGAMGTLAMLLLTRKLEPD